jgi:hypothetical protein
MIPDTSSDKPIVNLSCHKKGIVANEVEQSHEIAESLRPRKDYFLKLLCMV